MTRAEDVRRDDLAGDWKAFSTALVLLLPLRDTLVLLMTRSATSRRLIGAPVDRRPARKPITHRIGIEAPPGER